MRQVLTVCPYCGCGCGIYLQVEGEQVTGAMPSFKHPVAQGRLCIRGWHAHELTNSRKRIAAPMVRHNGKLAPATWPEALAAVAKGLSAAKDSPRSVGVLGSSRFSNEDNFVLMRFARTVLGTNNVDSASRLARNPAMVGAPGFMTDSIPSLGECDAVVVCGSDVAEQLPKAATEILLAAWRGMPLITISPRADVVSKCADQSLRARPETEAAVIDGLVGLLIAGEAAPAPEIAAAVAQATPAAVERATGVPESVLRAAAARLAGRRRVAVLCGTGVTQGAGAERTAAALARLAQVVGNGSGAQFMSPDANFQGACDMGIHPQCLPGYQPVADEGARAGFEEAWGGKTATAPGLDAVKMLAGAKAMLVMGDDPVASLVSSSTAGRALDGLDFLAVIDMFVTDTAARAHVVLPAASFAEIDGTFTNAERRVQRLRAAAKPMGESRAGWQIICELAEAMGSPIEYDSASAIMDEIARLTPLYADCSYGGLDGGWGWQWPMAGRAETTAAAEPPAADPVDAERPLLLAIDSTLYSWDTDVRPLSAPTLEREHTIHARDYLQGFVEMNAADGSALQVRPGQMVEVVSRHGSARLQAVLSDDVPPGTVLAPYQSREKVLALFGDSEAAAGRLPAPCPVAIRRA